VHRSGGRAAPPCRFCAAVGYAKRASGRTQIDQFGAGGSAALRECGLEVGALKRENAELRTIEMLKVPRFSSLSPVGHGGAREGHRRAQARFGSQVQNTDRSYVPGITGPPPTDSLTNVRPHVATSLPIVPLAATVSMATLRAVARASHAIGYADH
jgi:hypothetical protein